MREKKVVFITDIDGTIADPTHRTGGVDENLADKPLEWWENFYNGIENDPPIEGAARALRGVSCANIEVIYITGRHNMARQRTLKWLNKHGFPEGKLFTCGDGNMLKNKRGKLRTLNNKYNILIYCDDYEGCVVSAAEEGIPASNFKDAKKMWGVLLNQLAGNGRKHGNKKE